MTSGGGRAGAVLCGALLLAALLCAPAGAEGPGPPPGPPGEGPGPPPGPPGEGPGPPDPPPFLEQQADRLGLDEQTRVLIFGIIERVREAHEARRPQIRAAHERMHELLAADQPDDAAVMAQAEAIGALELADHKDRLMAMLAIRTVLSPEQRAELVRIREERHGRGHRRPPSPCARDLERLCSDAEPGQAALRCLDASWDALSPRCCAVFGVEPGSDAPPPPR
jgi:Spy/CpxP family protein refolding chaperone